LPKTDGYDFTRLNKGFFEEIAPNADDWVGEMKPPPPLSEEEERERERLFIEEWEAGHPGEAPFYNQWSGEYYYFD